ncbi:LacI family DNA-binding transcriptional regulator [Homoserinimonas sp. OAct 916]|uniref:LacI family DNA-binding transcriptional regulator n=1 Tax=Homoserinimonas sp. OAct 916 TaxID=2211450 RepID=UPI000DBE3BBD|nr:LacI family DNA-binding transcriptional regulator [Homoserinimonas sp. OAct 916]
MAQPTRSDVARVAGVSPAVVSYVVNGGPRGVSELSRKKVEAAIRQLGYRPNQVARALRATQTFSLGMLLPDVLNPFFWELVERIEWECSNRGYALFIATTDNDPERERESLRSFEDRRVDGIIVVSAASEWIGEERPTIPAVFIDRTPRSGPKAVAQSDDHKGSQMAVEHLLLEHRRRKVLLLAGPEALDSTSRRSTGAQSIIDRVPGASSNFAHGDFSFASGYEMTARAITEDTSFDAIFSFSDAQAMGAMRACADLGIRVPQDASLVSYDGTEFARYLNPSLTTVVQSIPAMASVAVEAVVREATRPGATAGRQTTEFGSVTLRIGESCGCSFDRTTEASSRPSHLSAGRGSQSL